MTSTLKLKSNRRRCAADIWISF